jgi:hypothetical protein
MSEKHTASIFRLEETFFNLEECTSSILRVGVSQVGKVTGYMEREGRT